MRYQVRVRRKEIREHVFEVEAPGTFDAAAAAEDMAHNFNYADASFVTADYWCASIDRMEGQDAVPEWPSGQG
jgi:hypothetical protein